ncbi:MAG: flippase-like domain-containing protein [Proteobacteria bacterium]|nr:flippase-like domain-containing protein [Pseudomonadota bacterium]
MRPVGTLAKNPRPLSRPIIKILVALIIGFGLVFTISDIHKIARVTQKIQPFFLFSALVATVLSYLFIGLALKKLLELVDVTLSFKEMFAISWVSTALNYLVSTGGIGGLTMRILLLRKKRIPFTETFLASFVHTLLLNGVLIGFVMFGFAYLLTTKGLRLYHHVTSGAVLALTLTLSVLATGSLINKAFRDRFIDFFYTWINRISVKLTKRTVFEKASLFEFKEEFHQGISLILAQKRDMVLPTIYVFLDWFCCLFALYWSFVAIGHSISPGILLVGFAIGLFVSLFSLIPGAIGIMEGSMAAIYYSLGVPLEVAIVAVLIYRIVYYLFPFVTSTLLYGPMFKEAKALKVSGVLKPPVNTPEPPAP